GTDGAAAVAVAAQGEAIVGGVTSSTDFPTAAAAQPTAAGSGDGFLARLSADGKALPAGTYWGGSSADQVNAVALGPTGAVYAVGTSSSTDLPVSGGAYQTGAGGSGDAFVAQL